MDCSAPPGLIEKLPHSTPTTRKPKTPACPRELKTIGDHLRKRRLDLGLLQRDVAQELGVDVQSIPNWEQHRSNPKVYLLPRIAEFLGYLPFEPGERASFVETLRIHRRAAGLSQEKLAQLAGIDESTIPKWERGDGRPMPRTRRRVRRFFEQIGMPMAELA